MLRKLFLITFLTELIILRFLPPVQQVQRELRCRILGWIFPLRAAGTVRASCPCAPRRSRCVGGQGPCPCILRLIQGCPKVLEIRRPPFLGTCRQKIRRGCLTCAPLPCYSVCMGRLPCGR